MPGRTRMVGYAAAATLLLTLVACDGSDEPGAEPTPSTSGSPSSTEAAPTPSASSSGGPADAPAPLTAKTDLLGWQPVDGPVDDVVTRNDDWTLAVTDDGDRWKLSGPGPGGGGNAPGWRVSDALLDTGWAVVVLQDKAEQRPSRAEVTDLKTGKAYSLNGRSDVPTTNGGTWALGEGRLLHATVDGTGAYCLAAVELATRHSDIAWCAPKRQGFNSARISPAGDSVLTFDDSQPACRTVVTVADGTITPYDGVPDCKAWEGIAVEDGAIWSIIPREQRVEEARLSSRVGDGYFDLGPGTAGTLTWCDGAAYFTRDPQKQGDPAALMRWSPQGGLAVVYQSPKGDAFIEAPRCGGKSLTITARTSSGDEQVTADL